MRLPIKTYVIQSLTRRSVFAAALLVLSALSPLASNLHIAAVVQTDGRLQMSFAASGTAYYILWRGETVTAIHQPITLSIGVDGTKVLIDASNDFPTAAFYRVQQVPLNRPLDVDGDGIDDIFELRRPAYLNPLNADDASFDPDGDGKSNLQEYRDGTDIAGSGPAERNAPVIALSFPSESSTITVPTLITGTITDASAVYFYRVDVAPADGNVSGIDGGWINISRFSPAPDVKNISGPLAMFDPTLLLNGEYMLRVQASDGANVATVTRQIHVNGKLKSGYARLEFTDLTLPLPGLPITVTRVYDSREAGTVGDFGYGWSLGGTGRDVLETGKVQSSGVFGGDLTLSDKSRVYLTLPDGRRVGFTFASENQRPLFKPDPGIPFTLEPLDPTSRAISQVVVLPTGAVQLPGGLFAPYGVFDPTEYRLIARDGVTYDYSDSEGLRRINDPAGNALAFTRNAITHSSGARVEIRRDALERITEIVDPAGRSIRYGYDARGDLVSITDQAGRITRAGYAPRLPHRVRSIIDSAGQILAEADYDEHGRVTSLLDHSGSLFKESYDPSLNIGTLTDGNGNITQMHYDDRGNLIKRIDPLGGVQQFFYDSANQATNIIDALGRSTRFTYDAQGNVTGVTNPLDQTTRIQYNAQSKPAVITDPLGRTTRLAHNASGEIISITDALNQSATIGRDDQNRITAFTDFNGNRTQFRYESGCDCGRPSRIIHPDGSSRSYDYDAFGRVLRQVDELNRQTTFTYDEVGNLTSVRDPLGHVTTYAYEGKLLVRETDPLGRAKRYEYDSVGNRIREIDALGGVAEFTYDRAGNRTSVKDPVGNITRFVYDELNRLKEQIDPLGHTNRFAFDAAGNRIEAIDRNGRRRTFTYDALNRMTNEVWWAGEFIVRSIEFGFNELGIQTLGADPAARYEYRYDPLNRLERVLAQSAGVPDFTLQYTYTAMGQVESVIDNWGVRVDSNYDNRNRLARRTWQGPGVDPARVDFAYDAAGSRLRTERFADLAGANRIGFTTNAYSPAGLVTNITHLGPTGSVLAKHEYTRDAAFQITQWAINSQLSSFSYDPTGQLINAMHATLPSESFRYDANGNRVGAQTSGNYVAGPGNQILSDGTHQYRYDAEGNMTSRSNTVTGALTTYEWDHRNRLVSVVDRDSGGSATQNVTFSYDAMDRRLTKTVQGLTTRFLFNEDDSWADLDGANTITARYLHGARIDELLARQRVTDGRGWYLTDHLGTVRDNQLRYESFGKIHSQSQPEQGDRFAFTGRELNVEIGLYYNRARYYSPNLGRFISSDPIGFDGYDWNLYRYVGNSPVGASDPTGLSVAERAVVGAVAVYAFSLGARGGPIYNTKPIDHFCAVYDGATVGVIVLGGAPALVGVAFFFLGNALGVCPPFIP